ncbi:MAG: thioredoxin-disulfide reductase, partial [Candidatus Kapaibacterium sp.]
GLKVSVFEGTQPGGQLTITTEVENYPGFEHGIMGPEMMDVFRKQAQRFGAQSVFETVEHLDHTARPFALRTDRGNIMTADAVIIATGARARLLGTKGEDEFMGYGVSACATCDGFFYKQLQVMVVGGGDTAMEEANYLTRFASKVIIVHRREEFRASKIMLERAKANPKIEFMTNTVIDEYLGKTLASGLRKLTSVRLRDVRTDTESVHPIDGVFVAIGHEPNTALVRDVVRCDANGYIITEGKSSKTTVEGLFACGDAQDSVYRQAITAAGSGCMAAIDAERWLEARHGA